jgi:hypothetical protein
MISLVCPHKLRRDCGQGELKDLAPAALTGIAVRGGPVGGSTTCTAPAALVPSVAVWRREPLVLPALSSAILWALRAIVVAARGGRAPLALGKLVDETC